MFCKKAEENSWFFFFFFLNTVHGYKQMSPSLHALRYFSTPPFCGVLAISFTAGPAWNVLAACSPLTITAASGENATGSNCLSTARAQNLIRTHAFLQLWPKTFVPLFYNRTVEMPTSGDIIRKKRYKHTLRKDLFFSECWCHNDMESQNIFSMYSTSLFKIMYIFICDWFWKHYLRFIHFNNCFQQIQM